jgi:tRNA threonylcarbamoyladenosine biosynthesis protein TsaB
MLLLALDTSSAQVSVAVHDGTRVLAQRAEGDGRHHAERLAPAIAAVLDDAGAARSDLTGVGVGVGPGPYTSLRIGLVTARVIGRALGVPVWGVCSLDVLAEQAVADSAVMAALAGAVGSIAGSELIVTADARRREIYWARYRLEAAPELGPEAAPELRPEAARESGPKVTGTAFGAARRPVRVSGPEVGAAAGVPFAGAVVSGRGVSLYPEAFGAAGVPGPQGVDAGVLAAIVAAEVGHPSGAAVLVAGASRLMPVEPLYLRPPDAVEPTRRKRVLGPV